MLEKQRFVSKVFISKTRKVGLFSFEALRNQVSKIKEHRFIARTQRRNHWDHWGRRR